MYAAEMLPRYDEFELTDSAYGHGYHDEDVAEMLRGAHLVIGNRRGRLVGYEIFGRNRGGSYYLLLGEWYNQRELRCCVYFI